MMDRRELYRPLLDRSLVPYQVQYLAYRYDFAPTSRVARLLVRTINSAMEEAEAELGIRRLHPWTLHSLSPQGALALPLLRPEDIEILMQGQAFPAARAQVRTRCLEAMRRVVPDASEDDLLRRIDPWARVRRKGPVRYVDCLEQRTDPQRGDSAWQEWISSIEPCDPVQRLSSLDCSAPEAVLDKLTHFAVREAGVGSIVARHLVEEAITLRNSCCLRPDQLRNGEMLVLATHVAAPPGRELAARFRRQIPVVVTVLTAQEMRAAARHSVPQQIAQLKRRIVRVCFEAYRQDGLLSLMDLQWIFQISGTRIGELIRSVQREQNIVVPTPGTILDAGRSLTHKDIIVRLHWEGYSVKEIARRTFHSPRAVDNYIGTFEAVLALRLYRVPTHAMSSILRKGPSLVNEYLQLIDELGIDAQMMRERLERKEVNL